MSTVRYLTEYLDSLPSSDGWAVRGSQQVGRTIPCFYIDYHQKNWVSYIPIAEFTHNNWTSETTRESPFMLLMGYNPCADWIDHPSPIPQVTLRVQQFKEARTQAQELMIKAQKAWVKHRNMPKFKVRDQVWLEGRNLRVAQPTAKLTPKRHRPFKVVQVMSPVNYHLKLPSQWSIHPVFHIDLLTPYHKTPIHGANYLRSPPDLIDREEEYEVEYVLAKRRTG